jgi:hypothetical protein
VRGAVQPITFIGRLHAVPAPFIAPTITLMVAGAVHASDAVRSRRGDAPLVLPHFDGAAYMRAGLCPLLPAFDDFGADAAQRATMDDVE